MYLHSLVPGIIQHLGWAYEYTPNKPPSTFGLNAIVFEFFYTSAA